MTRISVLAPAKINWTLEVLGKRDDGYHEVRTVLQTISYSDTVVLSPADDLALSVSGGTRGFRRAARTQPETNLAHRAARLLQERTGCSQGAAIRLYKLIPLASGLGGGSSDAAAVLRGLRRIWTLDIGDGGLAQIAPELGSDVPFFLRGGCALASGRGEALEPLPDVRREIYFVVPKHASAADKTARMYAALQPEHYTDSSRTEQLANRLRAGQPVRDEDIFNVFEAVLREVDREAAQLFEQAAALGIGRPHLCGSGPAFFFLTDGEPETLQAFERVLGALPCDAIPAGTVTAEQASRIDELS